MHKGGCNGFSWKMPIAHWIVKFMKLLIFCGWLYIFFYHRKWKLNGRLGIQLITIEFLTQNLDFIIMLTDSQQVWRRMIQILTLLNIWLIADTCSLNTMCFSDRWEQKSWPFDCNPLSKYVQYLGLELFIERSIRHLYHAFLVSLNSFLKLSQTFPAT